MCSGDDCDEVMSADVGRVRIRSLELEAPLASAQKPLD
jgi:hypothetical protein